MDPGPKFTVDQRNLETKGQIALTPEEQEIAKSIENLPLLDTRDKLELLLVWRGLKSAIAIKLPADTTQAVIGDLQGTIKQCGLFTEPEQRSVEEKKEVRNPQRILYVANNQKDLDLISQIWLGDHFKDPKVYKEIGRMSGFPKTAIRNYHNFARLDGEERDAAIARLTISEKEKKELIPSDLYYFSTFFYMSRDNWKSELQVVNSWMDELELVSPSLLAQYLNEAKKRERGN